MDKGHIGGAHLGLPGLALLQGLLAPPRQHQTAPADRCRIQVVPPQARRLHRVLLQGAPGLAPALCCCLTPAWHRELASHSQVTHALLKVEAFPQEQHALVAHLFQLLLQAQVVLNLLAGVVVAHACCPQHLLQDTHTYKVRVSVSL